MRSPGDEGTREDAPGATISRRRDLAALLAGRNAAGRLPPDAERRPTRLGLPRAFCACRCDGLASTFGAVAWTPCAVSSAAVERPVLGPASGGKREPDPMAALRAE